MSLWSWRLVFQIFFFLLIWGSGTFYVVTNIGGLGTFGRVFSLQRLKNQSLYHEILLLQKFNDTGGKVLKPKKISLQPQKKMRPFFSLNIKNLHERVRISVSLLISKLFIDPKGHTILYIYTHLYASIRIFFFTVY